MSYLSRDDYKYYDGHSSNHPSICRDIYNSFSSWESHNDRPLSTRSEIQFNVNQKPTISSFISDPIPTKIPLTEAELARHNNRSNSLSASSIINIQYEDENSSIEENILKRVDERCHSIKLEFDEKIKLLEEQFARTEEKIKESRCDIEELHSIEKEYINNGVQTDLLSSDIQKMTCVEEVMEDLNIPDPSTFKDTIIQWKKKAEKYSKMEEYVNNTKNIIWNTPMISIQSMCRQLPTDYAVETDKLCEYHLNRYQKLRFESVDMEHDNKATLERLSTWSNTLKQL
ncbi:hypothetical protein BDB01DRAFT_788 [Pilobolus umbonatus]|nr:hypothetical protein BDB01DRAFT_788 [Pilobolus umbonatus]